MTNTNLALHQMHDPYLRPLSPPQTLRPIFHQQPAPESTPKPLIVLPPPPLFAPPSSHYPSPLPLPHEQKQQPQQPALHSSPPISSQHARQPVSTGLRGLTNIFRIQPLSSSPSNNIGVEDGRVAKRIKRAPGEEPKRKGGRGKRSSSSASSSSASSTANTVQPSPASSHSNTVGFSPIDYKPATPAMGEVFPRGEACVECGVVVRKGEVESHREHCFTGQKVMEAAQILIAISMGGIV
ncbi:uncharacterized protein VTP21DRAFT_617 [Calcarisporiella thermophila]|uniref:uncharacterized protein n=1 Tax=Calcarisporiella thermophila TaxID=911321 RepID=UPI0037421BD7